MGGLDFAGWASELSTQDVFNTATGIGAAVGLGEMNHPSTLSNGDAVNGRAAQRNDGAGQGFAGLWDRLSGVVGKVTDTELSRYAAKRAYVAEADGSMPQPPNRAATVAGVPKTALLIGGGVLVLGLVAYLALRK